MQLVAYRVQKYRSVLDSGWIAIDPLTVLVGKNESGKTSLLRALHKLNPFKPEPYEISREWPRGHRREQSPAQIVCSARFRLNPEEKEALAGLTDQKMTAELVEVTRDYAGKLEVSFAEGLFPKALHPNDIDGLCEALPLPPAPVGEQYRQAASSCRSEAIRLAHEGRFEELASLAAKQTEVLKAAFTPGAQPPQATPEQNFVPAYSQKLGEVGTKLRAAPTMQQKAHDYVVTHLPTFIYMGEYQTFTGSAHLDQVKQRLDQKQPTPEDKTLLTILEMSGLSLEDEIKKASAKDREQRQYDLADGAATLTKLIEGHWGQLKYEVQFGADSNQFFTFVKDQKDRALIRLEERSRGFQWFFSFDLLFMHESKGDFRNCVLLLDEPGLHLHPGGQKDLLLLLDSYARDNTLIYSTHLPFMIDLRHPERIRVVSEKPTGTVVTDDLTESQPEAKLTLQAALGISGSQSYLVAQRNLVVEGADDFWLLTELSNLLVRSNQEGLPDDVLLTASGGASEAAYVATFMIGQKLDVVVLLDTDAAGDLARDNLVKKWLTRYKGTESQVLSIGTASGATAKEFAIEDLFPDSFYLTSVHEVYGQQLAAAGTPTLQLVGAGMVCKRVERAFDKAGVKFNKGSVAKSIRRHLREMKSVAELPPETLTFITKLFGAIRQAFPATASAGAAVRQAS